MIELIVRFSKLIIFVLMAGSDISRYIRIRAKIIDGISKYRLYDSNEIRVLSRLVKPGDTVLDVGANFGVYTHILSACVGPEGRVIAFEPQSILMDHLKLEFAPPTNVTLFDIALGANSFLSVKIYTPLLFGLVPEPALASLEQLPYKTIAQIVQVEKLDSIVKNNEQISFIKVDIEGHEDRFFEGARETILRCRPIVQFEENKISQRFGWHMKRAEEWNYSLCGIHKNGILSELKAPHRTKEINFYLIPRERLQEFTPISAGLVG